MTILIHDSPRNCLIKWAIETRSRGVPAEVVLNPFASQWPRSGLPSYLVRERVSELTKGGVGHWFDPMTHVLQMSGVGDFRYYDGYDLWSGARGALSTAADRADHVRRVFALQDRLSSPHLAPTVLLHAGLSSTTQQALELAEEAIAQDSNCWLSIAGTSAFWASGADLDAHIGALAQLEPEGWFVTMVRTHVVLPVEATADEIHGVCRTVRALSEETRVYLPHGDLAAVPALAAGALAVGTGWDQHQRVCGYTNFAARDPDSEGGAWYERPTLRTLLGSLKKSEALTLETNDRARYLRLGPPAVVGAKESYLHHAAVLGGIVSAIAAIPAYEDKYRLALGLYDSASAEWPQVERITSSALGASDWIDPLRAGLEQYGAEEGW